MGSLCSNCAKGVVFDPLMPGIDTDVHDPILIKESKIHFGEKTNSNNFDYRVTKQLSSNEFLVKGGRSSKKYFMKTYPLLQMNEKENSQISRELRILKLLKGENNFIRIHETVRHGEQLCVLYSDLPKSLHDFVLDERKKFDTDKEDDNRRIQYLERVKFIFFDLLYILMKVHKFGIYHFNLHPKNIRFGKSGELVLSGFEKSRQKRYLRIKKVFSNFRRKKIRRKSHKKKNVIININKRKKKYLKEEEEEEEEEEEKECLYQTEDESLFYPERVRKVERYLIYEKRRNRRNRRKGKKNRRPNPNNTRKFDNEICDGDYIDRYSLACILYFMVTNGEFMGTEPKDVNVYVRPGTSFSDDDDEDDDEDARLGLMEMIRKKIQSFNYNSKMKKCVDGVCGVIEKLTSREKEVDLREILEDQWLKM